MESFVMMRRHQPPQNVDSTLPLVRQHQQGGLEKKIFFAKWSEMLKKSFMRILVALRPFLIPQSTAWDIRARTKQALWYFPKDSYYVIVLVSITIQLKVKIILHFKKFKSLRFTTVLTFNILRKYQIQVKEVI